MRRVGLVAVCVCGALLVLFTPVRAPAAVRALEPAPALAVIAHPSARATRLDRNALAAIFRLSMRHWSHGAPIVALNYPPRHGLRVAFDRAVLGMTPDEVALFWIGQRVRGEGSAPRAASTPQLMLKVVENLRGAIGYVPLELRSARVVTVATISPEGRVSAGGGT